MPQTSIDQSRGVTFNQYITMLTLKEQIKPEMYYSLTSTAKILGISPNIAKSWRLLSHPPLELWRNGPYTYIRGSEIIRYAIEYNRNTLLAGQTDSHFCPCCGKIAKSQS